MTSDRKRQKVEEPRYTQGPLDEDFGQHRAFPLDAAPDDGEDSQVYQYLSSVRKEAEADQGFHYVERSKTVKKESEASDESIVPQEVIDEIMKSFDALKKARDERLEEQEEEDTEEAEFAVPESAAEWRKKIFSEQPDAQFLEFLEHTTIIKLIVYYTKWLLINMPEQLGKWIFTTFLRLDRDLDHKETAIVRDLGKKAVKLRAKVEEAEDVSPIPKHIIDMTLVIVGIYFRQRDLLKKDFSL